MPSERLKRLAKRLFGRREYSGTVSGVEYVTQYITGFPFTLYTIKTSGGKIPLVRGSIRGDYKGFDDSLGVGDKVEVTLGNPSDRLVTRVNFRKKHPEGTVEVIVRKVEWPPIASYKILEAKFNENPADRKNAGKQQTEQ